MTDDLPKATDVTAAAAAIADAVMNTPLLESQTLSAITGCTLYLKFENLQFTASFKERGALNKLRTIAASARGKGVCAMSAGNHAQAVAYHARRLGIPATIVMPRGTPFTKISRTKDHGAKVVIDGGNLTEAFDVATALSKAEGLTFVHPYDDPLVIAGQGTLGLEILNAVPGIDALVVPIGGGGLISGIAIAARALKPSIRIIGVQSKAYPSMANALSGVSTAHADALTIAEGIAVKVPGQLTRRIVAQHVDEILIVDEASIERAIALLLSIEKTVVEGAGAAGLAAILENPERFKGKKAATILSGGNIDLRVLASVALRDLVRVGRLLRFVVPITDQPGALARIATILGEQGANIIDIGHDRLGLALSPKGATLDVVVEVQTADEGPKLLNALIAQGFAPIMKEVS
ncbi:MAG: threonine ammonia-lyase [Rhodospirillaceae bacterium]|nr:threonine ammonia-lyase [Rhodospirillaceae bacterium]